MPIDPAHAPEPHARRGVTLSETLVAAAAVGVLLVVVALGMEGIQTELKRRQAIALMNTLDEALLAYHQAVGQWPVDAPAAPGLFMGSKRERSLLVEHNSSGSVSTPASAYPRMDGSADRIISQLAEVQASQAVLQGVPPILRVPAPQSGERDGRGSIAQWDRVLDPWGRPLHCLTATSPLVIHRKAVAANQNRPIFVSAGPDGRFGYAEVSSASDNIRSDENRD